MKTLSTRRAIAGIILSIVLLVVAGCGGGGSSSGGASGGNKLDGVYHGTAGGPISLTIKDGKATLLVANESKTMDYKVEGKKLILLNPEGNAEFTILDDGTLNGELGIMSKKP